MVGPSQPQCDPTCLPMKYKFKAVQSQVRLSEGLKPFAAWAYNSVSIATCRLAPSFTTLMIEPNRECVVQEFTQDHDLSEQLCLQRTSR